MQTFNFSVTHPHCDFYNTYCVTTFMVLVLYTSKSTFFQLNSIVFKYIFMEREIISHDITFRTIYSNIAVSVRTLNELI